MSTWLFYCLFRWKPLWPHICLIFTTPGWAVFSRIPAKLIEVCWPELKPTRRSQLWKFANMNSNIITVLYSSQPGSTLYSFFCFIAKYYLTPWQPLKALFFSEETYITYFWTFDKTNKSRNTSNIQIRSTTPKLGKQAKTY